MSELGQNSLKETGPKGALKKSPKYGNKPSFDANDLES